MRFNWSPLFGKSHDSSILSQDYGIIQGVPMNHMRFADWVTIWVVHLPEWTETGMAKLPPCIAAIAVTFSVNFHFVFY